VLLALYEVEYVISVFGHTDVRPLIVGVGFGVIVTVRVVEPLHDTPPVVVAVKVMVPVPGVVGHVTV
jgi:hypothetical protein